MTTIVFDADGMVLVGDYFSQTYSREFGIDESIMIPFFKGNFQECLTGKRDLKDELEHYLETWGWKGSSDELVTYWLESQNSMDERLVEYIGELRDRGVTCILATNNEKYRTQYMRDELGLGKLFDHVVSSCDVGSLKPSPDFMGILDEKAEEFVIWDDKKSHVDKMRDQGYNAELYTDLESFRDRIEEILQ